ncbi:MAG: helix-turn-helix domain-containing protein [Fimbriimonas sp.]
MNFAEALRQVSGPLPEPSADRPALRLVETPSHAIVDAPAAPSHGNHTVRLELSLSPEQLHALLKGVAQAQPTVLTLREASQLLRIPAAALQTMAEARQVPGFTVDGKWRFGRAALEAWLADGKAQEAC